MSYRARSTRNISILQLISELVIIIIGQFACKWSCQRAGFHTGFFVVRGNNTTALPPTPLPPPTHRKKVIFETSEIAFQAYFDQN